MNEVEEEFTWWCECYIISFEGESVRAKKKREIIRRTIHILGLMFDVYVLNFLQYCIDVYSRLLGLWHVDSRDYVVFMPQCTDTT